MSDYNELEIQLIHNTGTTYTVSVVNASVLYPNAQGTTVIDLDDPEIKEPLERIEREETDDHLFREFGGRLFDRIFVGNVRGAYDTNLTDAMVKEKDGVRIKLQITPQASSLYELPWILMHDPGRGWWLGGTNAPLHQRTPLSYAVRLNQLLGQALVFPLKILVVAASPSSLDEIDAQAELQSIQSAFQGLAHLGIVRIETLLSSPKEPVTRDAVQGRLAAWQPHILHFICHGPLSRHTALSSPGLFLERDDHSADFCNFPTLQALLQDSRETLKFIVLNACNSDGVAWSLAQQGIPALGMRYKVHGRAAE